MSKKIKIWTIVGFVVIILVIAKMFFNQKFDSVESLQIYMKRFGAAAPLILTVPVFRAIISVSAPDLLSHIFWPENMELTS